MANPWLPHFDDPAVRFDRGWTWPTEAEILAAKNQKTEKGPMNSRSYYPTKLELMPEWNDNFIAKLPGYETPLGLPPAHVDACIASLKYMNYVIAVWLVAVRSFGPAATSAVDLLLYGSGPDAVVLPAFAPPAVPTGVGSVPPGALTRLFALVGVIKAAPGYNETIGFDLRIVPRQDTTEHPVPEFTLKLEQGAGVQTVRIDFTKYGHQGVYIESRINGVAWAFLAIDTLKPYIDARPLTVAGQSETREYRMRWLDNAEPNGDWSPVQKVTVSA